MRQRLILIGILTALASAFTLADQPSPKTLTFNTGGEPQGLDPHLVSSEDAANLVSQLFESLVMTHPTQLGVVIPGVAKHWTVSPDGKTYTFYLRKNAKWSDDSPLTAEDFVYAWRRAIDPQTASPQASRYNYILNCKDYFLGKIKDPTALGFRAVDPFTFEVRLVGPFPPFLELVSMPTFAPVKRRVIEKYGDHWTQPGKMVSNGPFMLKEWRVNDRLILVKNPSYWDAKNVKLDQVVALAIEDLETAFKRYQQGEIDFNPYLPATKIPSLKSSPDFQQGIGFTIQQYVLNTKVPPLDNVKVRRALALALDRKTIVDRVIRLGQPPATGWIPPGVPGYPYRQLTTFDPEEARRLLTEAGFPNGQGFPVLTISYNTNETIRAIAEAIQQMWKKNLNIDVQLQNQEWKVHVAQLQSHHFQIARLSGVGEYIYPSTFLEAYVTGTPGNYSQWTSPDYDALWAEATREADPKKRMRIYADLEKMVIDNMPEIPIYFGVTFWLTKPGVKNVTLLPTRRLNLKYASVD